MKVELTLTNDSILAVNELLSHVYNMEKSNDKQENVYRSIGFELADKFDSKAKELIKKSSLFNVKKKYKFSLKYYEAWALEIILKELFSYTNNHYTRLQVNLIIDRLNQKLA
ncbi:hypothetical protein [Flavobacterium sp. '19STA2R22 D10 B1']|uniref:hypothetical protein n=1 Tax=Flavobacterium aerium TaxID=3037261 RepID=UPI00278BBB99|nr:hypothetical protein [Flavobacterium sp. '19STA2R22 D10 B1']